MIINKKVKRNAFFLCSLTGLLLAFLILVSCGKNEDSGTQTLEFKINSEVDEYGVPYYKVGGNGGDIYFSFTTNKSWYYKTELNSGVNFDVSQYSGEPGTINTTIKVNKNSNNTISIARISLYSTDGILLTEIKIEQNPYAIIKVEKQNVTIEQLGGQESINVKSNVPYELIIPVEYADWLSATTNNNDIVITCTGNNELTDRKGIIIIKAEDTSQEIEVTQKGGIYLNSQIVMLGSTYESVSSGSFWGDGVSGTMYILPPISGEYELEIITNSVFELELEENEWLTNWQLKKKTDNSYFYNFKIKAQDSDADGDRDALLTIKYSNGDISHGIKIEQRDWGINVIVSNNQSLSQKLRDEIMEGYKLKSLTIDGGNIDCNYLNTKLQTVKDIVIKNVENIPDYFCYDIKTLKRLELINVKKIGTAAFDFCSSLAAIYLPSSVEYIGNYAFYKTASNRNVYAKMTYPCKTGGKNSWGVGEWEGTLWVPLGSLDYYKSDDNWVKAFSKVKESSGL